MGVIKTTAINASQVFRRDSGGRFSDCVLQAVLFNRPEQIANEWFYRDMVGRRAETPLDSVVGNFDGTDDEIDFGTNLANTNFTYSNGTITRQTATTNASGIWRPSAGMINDIQFKTGDVFNDWFKLDENSGTTLYNSIEGRSNATLSNINESTFWTTDNDFTSWQNEVGYSEGVGATFIPATVDSTGKLTGLDALGNPLQHRGRVRYNVQIVDSNVYEFDGIDDFVEISSDISTIVADRVKVIFKTSSASEQVLIAGFFDAMALTMNGGRIELSGSNLITENAFNDGNWHEVEVKADTTGTVRYIVDGIEETTQYGSSARTTFAIRIGARLGGSSILPFNGQISRVQAYSGETLIADFKASEGGGTTAYDSSGNGNHGTITNADLATFHGTDNEARPDNLLDGFSQKLVCDITGSMFINNEIAYGIYDILIDVQSNTTHDIIFIADSADSSVFNGSYRIRLGADGSLTLLRSANTLFTKTNVFSTGDKLNIRVVRNSVIDEFVTGGVGTLAVYLFINDVYELIVPTSGSNPVLDNVYTTSKYSVLTAFSGSAYKYYCINNDCVNLFSFTDGTGVYSKVRVPARDNTTDAEGDELSNPAVIGHNNAESTLTNPYVQDADTDNFWVDTNGNALDKTFDDIVPNVGNYIFANTRNNNQKRNIVTVRRECQPLNNEEICQIKCSTNTGQVYTAVTDDTLICRCDVIDD